MRWLLAVGAAVFALPVFAQETAPAPAGSAGATVLNTFVQYLLPPIVTALAAAVAWALKKLSEYLHAKTEGSKVGQALVTGSDFIGTAVSHVIAGLAPDVRAALENDGKIDEAERAALKQKAMVLIKADLPEGIRVVLGGALGAGFETWLAGKAEQAIVGATSPATP